MKKKSFLSRLLRRGEDKPPKEKVAEKAVAVTKPEKALVVHKGGDDMNIELLISQAITKGTGIETMEKLLSMRKELKAEWAKEQYFAALTRFQSKCPEIKKLKKVRDKYGVHRYSFAPLDAIIKQVQFLLEECGLSFSIHPIQKEMVVKAVCRVHHIAGHSEETEFEILVDPEGYMNAAQQVASALTYAKRYAFCNALGIMTADEDDDGRESDFANAAGNNEGGRSKFPPMEVCPECGEKKVIPSKYDSGRYCLACKKKLPAAKQAEGPRDVTPSSTDNTGAGNAKKSEIYNKTSKLYGKLKASGMFSVDELSRYKREVFDMPDDDMTLAIIYGEMEKDLKAKGGKKQEPKEQDIIF